MAACVRCGRQTFGTVCGFCRQVEPRPEARPTVEELLTRIYDLEQRLAQHDQRLRDLESR